jgi:hypothetical protein
VSHPAWCVLKDVSGVRSLGKVESRSWFLARRFGFSEIRRGRHGLDPAPDPTLLTSYRHSGAWPGFTAFAYSVDRCEQQCTYYLDPLPVYDVFKIDDHTHPTSDHLTGCWKTLIFLIEEIFQQGKTPQIYLKEVSCMRGTSNKQMTMLSLVSPEQRVPQDHLFARLRPWRIKS